MEHPINIPELNVKGFADIVTVDKEDGKVYVYDIKTVNAWSWRFKFGRKYKNTGNPSIHQELQLGTYGYGVMQEFGRCDGLFLIFYNKDNSDIRIGEVSLDFIDQAYNYWMRVQDLHKNGDLPPMMECESPVMDWECKYCKYKGLCDERG